MKNTAEKLELVFAMAAALFAAAIPAQFVLAQAGYAKLSSLGQFVILPLIVFLGGIYFFSRNRYAWIARHIIFGAFAGFFATFGLEIVRIIGFHMGGMPGDMPKLLGVLLLDRFLEGPSLLSNLAGWAYHFTNGAAFGAVLALILGRVHWWTAVIYAQLIGISFMVSPVVTALGIGKFGVEFGPGFAITVTLAHLAFGLILGILQERWIIEIGALPRLIRNRIRSITGGQMSEDSVLELIDYWDHISR